MLAVIPARGGSKGVPRKNIKELAGKPLISYTIESAIKSNIFEKVIVSTDNNEIAQVALQCGAEIPFIRPVEISGDMVSSDDVVIHALDFYKKQGVDFEIVCKLQPTSPLRNGEHIKQAYAMFCEQNADFVVSVCECEHSPLWSGILGENCSMKEFIKDEVKRKCRQELPVFYRLNGAIYMGKTDEFCKNRSFLGLNSYAYIMEQKVSVDIDSWLDFLIAEVILRDNGNGVN